MKLILVRDDLSQAEARCDRCKYWGEWRRDGQRPARFNASKPHDCGRIESSTESIRVGYADYVWTDPDFGCALFETKEKA